MERNEDYENVCKNLDELVIIFVNVMSNLFKERKQLDLNLKEGFFNMAKSRYSMGSKRVSMLQVDLGTQEALMKVTTSQNQQNGLIWDTFNMSTSTEIQHEEKQTAKLRQRKEKKEVERNANLEELLDNCALKDDKTDHNSSKVENKAPSSNGNDPLRWFGVLVPQSLRHSQKQFQESVHNVIYIASLQSELHALTVKYKELLDKKQNLKAQLSA